MTNQSEARTRLRELRELARVTIQDAASVLDVSYTHLWNAEHGHAKLRDAQIERLEALYTPKIQERLKRLSRALGARN